jgi:DNA-directed RNA polymerase beta' subunit
MVDNKDVMSVDQIEFTIYDDPIRHSELADINIVELYSNAEPRRSGLWDPRMTYADLYIDCSVCGLAIERCVGHNQFRSNNPNERKRDGPRQPGVN